MREALYTSMVDARYLEEIYGERNIEYQYPDGLDLTPGSDLHNKILELVLGSSRDSYEAISPRHAVWEKIDKALTAYVPADTVKGSGFTGYKDGTTAKVQKTIIMPVLYAIRETVMAQLIVAFMDSPIFKYDGENDPVAAGVAEYYIRHQTTKMRTALNIHTMLMDAITYGVGVVHPYWYSKKGKRVVFYDQDVPGNAPGEFMPGNKKRRKLVDELLYEGTMLENIDPYRYLPDPNVPINEPDKSTSVGWLSDSCVSDLLIQEKDTDMGLFNCKYLLNMRQHRGQGSSVVLGDDRRDAKSGLGTVKPSDGSAYIDVVTRFFKLIPKEHGLSDSTDVEYWQFAVAADAVVIQAAKCDYPDDSSFPVIVAAPDYDGHSLAPISRLEINYGQQHNTDMLISSHLANVQRSVNDIIAYDPSVFNARDVNNPVPGGRWRVKRRAHGRTDLKQSLFQVPVQNYTQALMQDAMILSEQAHRGAGATETLQGNIPRRGERVSSYEAKAATGGGLSKIDRLASVVSWQAMIPLGEYFLNNAAWNATMDRWVSLTGRHEKTLRRFIRNRAGTQEDINVDRINIQPEMISTYAEVQPLDPRVMHMTDPELYMRLYEVGVRNPDLLLQVDFNSMFLYAAKLMGAKNVQDFMLTAEEVQMKIAQREQLMKQEQQGDIVPVEK